MSNRDGRTAKHSKVKFRQNQLCKRCGKGHYQHADCNCKRPQHFICNVCHHSNF